MKKYIEELDKLICELRDEILSSPSMTILFVLFLLFGTPMFCLQITVVLGLN